jgi:putative phosphoribosyl transferase
MSQPQVNEKHTPFPDLRSAGRALAAAISRDRNSNLLVLAIVSAGVPVAFEVAKALESALDLIIIRRLLAPDGPGSQACAVNVAGTLVIDEKIGPRPAKPQTPFDYFREDALNGIAERTQLCRGQRPAVEVSGKHLLIVDCGIRTALTMQAAIGAARTLNPARITAAVPVTSHDGRAKIEPLVDELIYLLAPEPFGNAGVWFKDFGRPKDEDINGLLDECTISSTVP